MVSLDIANVKSDWRKCPGFTLATFEDDRQETDGVVVTSTGDACAALSGPEGGVTYQYHAVISNEMNKTQGEMVLFVKK